MTVPPHDPGECFSPPRGRCRRRPLSRPAQNRPACRARGRMWRQVPGAGPRGRSPGADPQGQIPRGRSQGAGPGGQVRGAGPGGGSGPGPGGRKRSRHCRPLGHPGRGRNATSGNWTIIWRRASSDPSYRQPSRRLRTWRMIGAKYRLRRSYAAITAIASASPRKRVSAAKRREPMVTSGLGEAWMLRSQSAPWPKPLTTTASGPSGRNATTSRTVRRRLPVRRPTWTSSRKRWPSSLPQPQRYRQLGARNSQRSGRLNRGLALDWSFTR
jgi:hypothetical protein